MRIIRAFCLFITILLLNGHVFAVKHWECLTCRDDDITDTVLNKIEDNRCLSYQNINVSTYEGVVTLEGSVENQTQIHATREIVASVPNVREIKVNLTIKNKYNI